MIVWLENFDFIIFYIDDFLQERMIPDPKTFDALKYRKMTQMIQTKHRFGILVEFTYNIAFQTRFENSSGSATYDKII